MVLPESDLESEVSRIRDLGERSGAEDSSSHDSEDVDPTRPRRRRRPPRQLTYDTIGEPSYYPQVSRITIQSQNFHGGDGGCQQNLSYRAW